MFPQVGMEGGTPMPKKVNDASEKNRGAHFHRCQDNCRINYGWQNVLKTEYVHPYSRWS